MRDTLFYKFLIDGLNSHVERGGERSAGFFVENASCIDLSDELDPNGFPATRVSLRRSESKPERRESHDIQFVRASDYE